MKRIMILLAFAACTVYAANAQAQMDPNASAGMTTAPVVNATMNPVAPAPRPMGTAARPMALPMTPEMALARPTAAPMTPAMAPPSMEAPMASTAPAMASEKPSEAMAPAGPKESGWDKADKWIGRLQNIVLMVVALIFGILGLTSKKEWAKNKRLQNLTKMALDNYSVVEKLAATTGWKGDDKLAQLFKRILLQVQAEGQKPLSAEEKAHVARVVADKAAIEKVDNGNEGAVDADAVTEKPEA